MKRQVAPSFARVLLFAGLILLAGCHDRVDGRGKPGVTLAPCRVPGVARPAACGTFAVAENRDAPARTISLRIVVIPATASPSGDAVFFLTGGPGTAATASAGFLAREFAPLANTHDFVFVDQRGTGASNPLGCPPADPGSLSPLFGANLAARCRSLLEGSADLSAYTTADAVADLEAIRTALGYERISLHGSSYGTRVAWSYAAKFPRRARAVVLHGPVPPGFLIPLPFAKGLNVALRGVVEDCLADAACAARFPRLKDEAAAAFEGVRERPARVALTTGTASGLTSGELAEAVRYMLYSPMDARRVPLLLSQAGRGDYTPLARASVEHRRRLEPTLHTGMYLSVTCAEDIPFIDESAVAAAVRQSRLSDYRVRQQAAACASWPRRAAPRQPAAPLDVPTLLLAGEYDPATPLEWARRAAALLSDGRLVVVPHGAHTFNGLGIEACLQQIATTFIRDASTRAVDDRCVAQAERPPFLLH